MSKITINLVVLRSPDLSRAVAFYSRMGLQFEKHQHGKGVEHYAAELPGGVFELYPQNADFPVSLGARIGFAVPSLDAVFAVLSDYPNSIISAPKDSEWGRRAVITDPDGHRVEVIESKE